jgi:type IV pilus assembly protein PilF
MTLVFRNSCVQWTLPGLLLALACGTLSVTLAGCAANGGLSATASPDELTTAQDDSPERKRARVRLQLAATYYQAGKNTIALDEVKRVMQTDPTFSDAYDLAGLIYQALEQPQLAEQHFRRAIALNPHDGSPMQNLGWLQCQQKHYVQADQSFNRALAVPGYPDRAKTLMVQGICQTRANNLARAEATLKRAYSLDLNNATTAYALADVLYRRGRYADAQPYIQRLNNNDSTVAPQSLWLGIKIERALGNRVAVQQLGNQLLQRFGDSHEASLYRQGAFNE